MRGKKPVSTCAGCGRRFASVEDFDSHFTGHYARLGERTGSRRCMSDVELYRARFHEDNGLWHMTKLGKARRKLLRAA